MHLFAFVGNICAEGLAFTFHAFAAQDSYVSGIVCKKAVLLEMSYILIFGDNNSEIKALFYVSFGGMYSITFSFLKIENLI
jgi:hypothetical protein